MGVFVVVARIRWVWVFRGGGSCGFRGGGWDQVGVGRSSCFVDFFFFFLVVACVCHNGGGYGCVGRTGCLVNSFFFSYYGLCHNGGGGCVDRSSWLVDFLFLFFFSCHELWLPQW